jgi:hypothetical protein
MVFNRAKDRQRILQEDPEIISAWFELVRTIIKEYRVYTDDIYNFNKTSF